MTAQFVIAEIPIGPDGFNGSNNQATVPITALIKANNVTFEQGVLQKEGGAQLYTTTTPPMATTVKIIAGSDWFPSGTTQRPLVLTSSGTLLKDDGSGAYGTSLATALSPGLSPMFVEGGKESAGQSRQLFLYTGGDVIQSIVGDPASTATLSAPATDWLVSSGGVPPTFGVNHKNRIWSGGNGNDPHRIYYSTATDHQNYTSGGSLSIFPGEAERLVGGISFRKILILFKRPRGIYFVDTRDPLPANWVIDRHNRNIGLAGNSTLTQVDLPNSDDVFFMDPHGTFRFLSQVLDESYGTRDISLDRGMDEWMRDNANLADLESARMVYYADKREVHIAVPRGTATELDRRVVLDMNRSDYPRFRISDRDANIGSLWMQSDSSMIERLTMGDEFGRVWNLDQSGRSKGALGYEGSIQTPHHDMEFVDPSLAIRRKAFKFIEIEFVEAGNHEVFCDVHIDGDYKETVSFNMGDLGDSFTYTFPIVFRSGGKVVRKRRRIRGSGYRISLVFRNDGAAEDFKIAKIFIGFKPSSQRLPK